MTPSPSHKCIPPWHLQQSLQAEQLSRCVICVHRTFATVSALNAPLWEQLRTTGTYQQYHICTGTAPPPPSCAPHVQPVASKADHTIANHVAAQQLAGNSPCSIAGVGVAGDSSSQGSRINRRCMKQYCRDKLQRLCAWFACTYPDSRSNLH